MAVSADIAEFIVVHSEGWRPTVFQVIDQTLNLISINSLCEECRRANFLMCLGIPMQVVEQREYSALCRGRYGERVVETLLIGPQPEGAWILSFMGTAREVLSAEDAKKIEDALSALEALSSGSEGPDLEACFPDLTASGRPPGGYLPGSSD